MRSVAGPPNTMAPIRPLPIGSASFQSAAGRLYHSFNPLSLSSPSHAQRLASVSQQPAKKVTRFILPVVSFDAPVTGTLYHLLRRMMQNIVFHYNIQGGWTHRFQKDVCSLRSTGSMYKYISGA